MRPIPIIVALLLVLTAPVRADWFGGLVGNDTGGIIPWSPDAELNRRLIAADHCARYFKLAKITSVHRQYGDYIGFHCLFPPPRPVLVVRTRGVVVRSLF